MAGPRIFALMREYFFHLPFRSTHSTRWSRFSRYHSQSTAEMAASKHSSDEQYNWRNFWICFIVSLGQIAFGYPASIIGVT